MSAVSSEQAVAEARHRSDPVTTLVVDDQESFRDAMRHLIAATPGFTLVGEAASGEAALIAVEELKPELVLMDVRMPGIGGIEAARTLADCHPEVMVVLTSVHGPEELFPAVLGDSVAAPFVLKKSLRPDVLRGLWERQNARSEQ
jgi:two-component system, NarL family, invasion response regulator UvrY